MDYGGSRDRRRRLFAKGEISWTRTGVINVRVVVCEWNFLVFWKFGFFCYFVFDEFFVIVYIFRWDERNSFLCYVAG